MRCWPDKGDHPTTAITSDGTPHPLLGPGPVVVHMFIIPPRDAILDLPFREPKDLSTPLPSPSAPRRRSSPSSRRAHERRGPPPRRTPACPCGTRRTLRRGGRPWSPWTASPRWPFAFPAASPTATGLLPLGGTVHPTEPSARPVQRRRVGRLPPPVILHHIRCLPGR